MKSLVALDVAPGSVALIPVVLLLMVVLIILLEGGVLALAGLRPVSKAFVASFVSNMAGVGGAVVGGAIGSEFDLSGIGILLTAAGLAMLIQAIVVMSQRAALSRALVVGLTMGMKAVEVLVIYLGLGYHEAQ